MKKVEDIERMSLDELMNAAQSSGIQSPADLGETLRRTVDTLEFIESEDRPAVVALRRKRWAIAGMAACMVALLGTGLTVYTLNQPKDTFSDPAEAYAQVERTLSMVSHKVNKGMHVAREAGQESREASTYMFDMIKYR